MYEQPYTRQIITNIQNKSMSKEQVFDLLDDCLAKTAQDPYYLASLEESIKVLYGTDALVQRMRDREKLAQ